MTLSVRVRLTMWYIGLLALVLTALGAFLLLRLKSDLIRGVDRSLDSRAAQISLGYEGGGEGEFQDVSDASLVRLPQGEHGAQILSGDRRVLETAGDPVAERPMLDREALARAIDGHHVRLSSTLGPDYEPFRVLAILAPRHPQEVLVVATSLEEVDASGDHLLALLLIAGPVALLGAALVGWWMAWKALRPVARITAQAAQIGVDRLHERVSVPKVQDELGRLARTFNEMLDRLERGVEEKRRFVADASHELRTPLAVMRSELDVSLRARRMTPEAREVLESAVEEVDHMTRIVENLLTLARIDEGRLELVRTDVQLGEVARAVIEALKPLADARGVRVVEDNGGAAVWGDGERLYQVAENLLDNAVKYTPPEGEVRVAVWQRGEEAGMTVSDTGPGIPNDALPRVFDRFFRVDRARARSDGGSGLGLAICREIVEGHGGRVWVESDPGVGSSFSFALPLRRDGSRVVVPASSGPA